MRYYYSSISTSFVFADAKDLQSDSAKRRTCNHGAFVWQSVHVAVACTHPIAIVIPLAICGARDIFGQGNKDGRPSQDTQYEEKENDESVVNWCGPADEGGEQKVTDDNHRCNTLV